MKNRYTALVHKDPDTEYGVSFPDFPGCTSLGETYEAALDAAAKALAIHVELMQEEGEAIPAPRSFEDIQADPNFVEDLKGAVFSIVPLVKFGHEKVRANLSFDKSALEAIDRAAARRGKDRSEFLTDAGLEAARAF